MKILDKERIKNKIINDTKMFFEPLKYWWFWIGFLIFTVTFYLTGLLY